MICIVSSTKSNKSNKSNKSSTKSSTKSNTKSNITPIELKYRKQGSVKITFPHMRIHTTVDDREMLPHYEWEYVHEANWSKSANRWHYYFSGADENFFANTIKELVKDLKNFIAIDYNVKSVGTAEIE